MRVRNFLGMLAALALCALPAKALAAPDAPWWYIAPVIGMAYFEDELDYPQDAALKDALHYGARIGWQFHPVWGIEAVGGYSTTDDETLAENEVTYMHVGGAFTIVPVRWKIGEPFLSFGGSYTQRDADVASDDLHFGAFDAAVGWHSWFGDNIALRLEARNILMLPKEDYGSAKHNDALLLGGLSFAFGGKKVDTDGDGVSDNKDKCPDTPAGATVDATGCPADADGDGVFDGIDQCAGTAKGARVDARGCPTDSDGDGVFDGLDQCENTPRGATVNAQGCPSDADTDGVPDGIDTCPNTPTGATVNETGCPTDSDGDSVPDGLDRCPGTAAGARVDATGCPVEVAEREIELLDTGMIRMSDVNFETGKAVITPDSYPSLDIVGQVLTKWPGLKMEVGGHTDSRGSNATNLKLSDERANAVRTYLVQKFPSIKPDQLTAKGYGESKPVAPNNSALNMAKNRRVEFVVTNKEVLKQEAERRKQQQQQ
jgi:outer membrane protein OmpA-like peptidoglycan-associated protein